MRLFERTQRARGWSVALVLLSLAGASPARAETGDRAEAIAMDVMARMGGEEAWRDTRFLSWRFFGRRQHYWDRATGDIRIEGETREGESYLILMNIHSMEGRAWKDGSELSGDALAEWIENGHKAWVNDSYWMFMPYKLLDPGAHLSFEGQGELADGRPALVLELTFDPGVGYTPQNRYEIFVGRDSGLVEQWAFYADASDDEPQFTMPWSDWKPFGKILLATNHGRDLDWEIAVPDDLSPAVFRDPAPVAR